MKATGILLSSLATLVASHPVIESREIQYQPLVDVSKFRIETAAEYTSTKSAQTAAQVSYDGDYIQLAKDFVKEKYPAVELRLSDDHYVGASGIAHVYFKQTANGVDIANANFNVNVRLPGMKCTCKC